MASSEKNNNNDSSMNFNEIIFNINSLKSKNEFITIQTIMNEIFMNSSFIKESSYKKEIITKLDENIFYINNQSNNTANSFELNFLFISLSFLNLLETKIKNIPPYILESILIDNNKIVNLYKNIFIYVYKKNIQIDNFQLPSLKNFVNFTFKYPDIINNFFKINFINTSLYYIQYFVILLQNLEIFEIRGIDIIQKIYILKLFNLLFQTFLSDEIKEENIKKFFEILDGEELYKDEFIKKYFIFNDYINNDEFIKINKVYHYLDNFEKFGKFQKIIRKNPFFLSHIMNSKNEKLQKKYFDEILIVLKEKTNILEEIEIYEFYQVFFSIFYLLEVYNGFNYLNIFDSIMKICFIVMEKVKDKNKKGIIQIFLKYIKAKMIEYLKSKGGKPENDMNNAEEENILSENGTSLLCFNENNKKKFENNIFYFCEIKENSFKIKFYKEILGIDFKIINNLNNSQNLKESKNEDKINKRKSKIVYKSVKFQKKYGVFESNKNKLINEMNNKIANSNKNDIINENVNLPFYNNNLKIHLESNDDFNDLYKMKSPMYLKDCILGLNSQYRERQELSLKALPSLLESQPMDLDFYIKSLVLNLLSMNDNFDLDEYDELKEEALVKLAKYSPSEVTQIFCEKFFSENTCGLKIKFLIINVLNRTVTELSEYYIKNKKPKVNNFHIYFNNIIFPLLSYLKKAKLNSLLIFKDFDILLSKFIVLVSNIINVSENHPVIYRALFEAFDLFQAIINLKEIKEFKTFSLLESLNCFVNVTLNFYEKNFINIYPEFLPKFKEEVNYLNNLLDDKQLNDDLRFKILSTLNKFTIQSDKLHDSFFGNQNSKIPISSSFLI